MFVSLPEGKKSKQNHGNESLDIKLVTLQCSVVYIAGSQPLGNANLICSIHMYRIKLSTLGFNYIIFLLNDWFKI